ncbi:MAG TPA: SGNH/GDSL hydrolase family protein, partial [Armatimonadota bacterium]|nr:SGNH/GDSL hydrolase family protein [Armatimonadota bacterium]
ALGATAVNLGVGGYGPQQELLLLEKYGLAYGPKTVVWEFFEGNDLRDAEFFAQWKGGGLKSSRSLVQRYLDNSLINDVLTPTLPAGRGFGNTVWGALRSSDGSTKRLYLGYPYVPDEPLRRPLGAAETERAIEAGYRLCRSRGIRLLVVFIPSMPRVLEQGLSFDDPADRLRFFPGGRVTDERDFGSLLARVCRRLDCPFLDTFPALRRQAARDNRDLYVLTDEHLDIVGHQIVADLITARLRVPEHQETRLPDRPVGSPR